MISSFPPVCCLFIYMSCVCVLLRICAKKVTTTTVWQFGTVKLLLTVLLYTPSVCLSCFVSFVCAVRTIHLKVLLIKTQAGLFFGSCANSLPSQSQCVVLLLYIARTYNIHKMNRSGKCLVRSYAATTLKNSFPMLLLACKKYKLHHHGRVILYTLGRRILLLYYEDEPPLLLFCTMMLS
jgi:hypothetical protein